jgi:hypothetical protein
MIELGREAYEALKRDPPGWPAPRKDRGEFAPKKGYIIRPDRDVSSSLRAAPRVL